MDEAAVQEAAAQYEQTQQRLQGLDQHLARLEQSLREIDSARSTLTGLVGEGEPDTLVPIGAGVRIKAKVDAAAPVLVDLGAGTAVETDAEAALERLQARREATESAFRAANEEADRLTRSLQEIQQSLAARSD